MSKLGVEPLEGRALLSVSTSLVQDSADGSEIPGTSSELTRDDRGVTATVNTTELQPGVYTVWLVAFNNPEFCHGACGRDDNMRDGVDGSVMYLTGEVVEGDGMATFTGYRAAGDTEGTRFGPGLVDPNKAEIHLAIRYHGAVIPERVDEQLTTFEGGCDVNTCSGAQFVVHAAPDTEVSISPVQRSSDQAEVEGATSRLTRNDSGVAATVATTELQPGVYTVWLVAFNNPEFCHGTCGRDDNMRDGVDGSVMYLTGEVVEGDGMSTFTAQRAAGDTEGTRFGPGLVDPSKAEIHLAIRYHGAVIPERVDEQLTTFEGGCDVNSCRGAQSAEHIVSPQFRVGDANGDFQFDQQDIAQVLQAGKYRTGEPASFAEGDWNVDGVFDNLDVIAALKAGNYLQGPYAAHSAEDLRVSELDQSLLSVEASDVTIQPIADSEAVDQVFAAGDANRDGVFDQDDVVQILSHGKYLSGQAAGWSQGDFTGDGRFDQQDIVAARQSGSYAQQAFDWWTSAGMFVWRGGW